MRSKAPETAKSKPAPPVAKPAAPAPAHPSNPLQPAAGAPGKPHAVAPEPVPVTPAPVVLFGRSEDEAAEPHWIDPVTGFPDTQRRRDGSLFGTPKA